MTKKLKYILGLLALMILTPIAAPAQETNTPESAPVPRIFTIPIEGMIEKGLIYVIRRGVIEAEAAQADAVIFEMDTPGGAVDATEEIIAIMASLTVPTYTLVKHNAISAGAIIALSTDHIYMMPGSKIGDAMPIMASPTGGVQPLPDAEREKITSYVDTIIRGTAEQNGHNKELASCMVRREKAFSIGDEVICPEGELLTMTNVEARQLDEEGMPILSEGTVDSLEDLLDRIGLAGARVTRMEVTVAERIARFIAALAPLFLMAGLLGLYLEFKTPGFGLPGILGGVALAIYFWGHHIAGLAGMEEVVIVIFGVVLLAVEVFVTPGFGVIGLAGLMLMMWGLLNAMIEKLPNDPWYPSLPDLPRPTWNMAAGLFLAMVGAIVAGRFISRSRSLRPLVLDAATRKDEGYMASHSTDDLLDKSGKAITDLHPVGSAMFGDQKVDVVTRGEFVPKDSAIRVVETHGNRVVVEEAGQG